MYFGFQATEHTPDSKGRLEGLNISGNDRAIVWSLSKVIDWQGNYYVIEYQIDGTTGAQYPIRITYTKNELHPIYSFRTVEFSYEMRNDRYNLYNPTKVNLQRRLKWISVKIGGLLLRKYRFDYEYGVSTGRSRLVAIQEYGSDGNSPPIPWVDGNFIATGKTLPPLKLNWQDNIEDGTFELGQSSAEGTMYLGWTTVFADINGDGKADWIRWRNVSGIGSQAHVSLSKGDGTFEPGEISSEGTDYLGWTTTFTDINGDGKADWVRWRNISSSSQVHVSLSKGDGTFEPAVISSDGTDYSGLTTTFTDINGDGKADWVRWINSSYIGSQVYVRLSKGDGTFEPTKKSIEGYSESTTTTFTDINGDGKADWVRWINTSTDSQVYVSFSKGDGTFEPSAMSSEGANYSGWTTTFADINGDGKADWIKWINTPSSGSQVYVSFSKGDGTFELGKKSTEGTDYSGWTTTFADINGDGKADWLRWKNPEGSPSQVYVSLSKGNGTFVPGKKSSDDTNFYNWPTTFADINGDGKADWLRWKNTIHPGSQVLVSLSKGSVVDLLTTVYPPTGGSIGITYAPAPQVPGAVNPIGKTYPIIANCGPCPLVREITYNDGFNNLLTFRYDYSDGMIRTGFSNQRVNLGFSWIEKTDVNTGSSVRTWYLQDDLDLRLMEDKEEAYGANRLLYLEKKYQYTKRVIIDNSATPSIPSVNFIFMSGKYQKNYNGESGNPVTYYISYNYDSHGNLSQKIDEGDISVITDNVQYDWVYDYVSANNMSLITSERKTGYLLSGQTGLFAGTDFFYNSNYLLDHQVFLNGAESITNSYGYDNYGNKTSITDGRENVTTIQYDPVYQTWVRYQTNPLNQTIETIYDALMRPIQVIDANEAVTEMQYDVFSRETAKILPGDDGANPTSRITYWNEFVDTSGEPLFPARERMELKESGTSFLEKYKYYDGLGRLVQEKSEAKNGWTTVDYFYDNSGRQWKTSMPYISGSYAYSSPDTTVKARWIEYDPIGREAVFHNSDDTVIQKIYGKYDILTVDPNGHVVNQRIVGNTEYSITYDGVYPNQTEYAMTTKLTAGDGIRVTDAKGNIFTTSLDMLGRKTGENNPGMGVWSYGYDANNNLIAWTDGKMQTVSILYDALNRPTEKDYPDGTKVNYYYDEAGHGYSKGRVTRVVYPGGSESYYYDARGRTTSITQTIDGISKTQSLTYDSMDRVVTQTYPDGEVVTFSYEVDGNLKSVNGNSNYVGMIEYTPFNKVSKILYGNGVQTIYDYYDTAVERDNSANTYFSYRLKGIQTSKFGSSLLNLEYEYDKNDNVKVKRDLNNGNLTENYDYDARNRLTSASSGVYGSKVYQYDQINNITLKDGRSYSYNSDRPYAVASDGVYTYTYDANGNMIGRSDGRIIAWDYENRVSSISDGGIFTYNSGFRRIKKVEGGVTTLYFFDTYEEDYQGGTLTKASKFYFANNQRVAEQSNTDGLRYYHQDHLGSSSAITDASGNLVLRSTYQPYGSDAYNEGSAVIDYKFTGQEKDNCGLYYYGARYYDPELGRFISPDPAQDGGNWYVYCNDNPVMYIDPTGLRPMIDIGGPVDFEQDFTDTTLTIDEDGTITSTTTYEDHLGTTTTVTQTDYYNTTTGECEGSYTSISITSPKWMRLTIPGQEAWDNARTNFANGQYFWGFVSTAQMVGEDLLFVLSFGKCKSLGGLGVVKSSSRKFIEILDSQIGKKLKRHAREYGLPLSREGAAAYKEITINVLDNREQIRVGSWMDLGECEFWIRGRDVAIVKNNRWISTFPLTRPGTIYYIMNLPLKK